MQIDFHHAVTYVAARIAGFKHEDADIVAYAAQYVDDCTCSGTIWFDDGAMYSRISSAHKCLDLHNLSGEEDHVVWIPFHFLPGNCGVAEGQDCRAPFVERIVCRPGHQNPVAQALVGSLFAGKQAPNALHRLGITMHVYADTWAHQGFAGIEDDVNDVTDIECATSSGQTSHPCLDRLRGFIQGLRDRMLPALGHARAEVFPDMPFLKWQYRNGNGEIVPRDNTAIFTTAADELCKVMQRYLKGSPSADAPGLGGDDKEQIRRLFSQTVDENGENRHKAWLQAIKDGVFKSFGPADVTYDQDGQKTWKAHALGTAADRDTYPYAPGFLRSDWKMFHDALQQHRLTLLHDILPAYNLCAG